MVGIYKITFIGTDKCYIGSSFNIATRKTTHLNYFKNGTHHSIKLQNAYNKYGVESLIFEVVEECANVSRDELFTREQYFIDLYDSFHNGYNMSPSAWTYIHEWTDEDRAAKSASMVGELNHFYGKSHTKETIDRIKANKKDTTGANNPFFGKTHSEESKLKFKATMEAKKHDPAYVHPLAGKPKTKESITKMKASMPQSTKCTIDGVNYASVSEASLLLGVGTATIRLRLRSYNFPNYVAESIPKNTKKSRIDLVSCIIDGVEYTSASAASKVLGIKYSTVVHRINSKNFPNYMSTRATTIENTHSVTSDGGSE